MSLEGQSLGAHFPMVDLRGIEPVTTALSFFLSTNLAASEMLKVALFQLVTTPAVTDKADLSFDRVDRLISESAPPKNRTCGFPAYGSSE